MQFPPSWLLWQYWLSHDYVTFIFRLRHVHFPTGVRSAGGGGLNPLGWPPKGLKRRFNQNLGRSRICQYHEIKYTIIVTICICVCVCIEREKREMRTSGRESKSQWLKWSLRVRKQETREDVEDNMFHRSDTAWWRHAHEQGLPSRATGCPRTRSDHEQDSVG